MSDYIKREDAITAFANYLGATSKTAALAAECILKPIPAAPVREVVSDTPHIEDAIDAVLAERRRQIKLFGDQSGTPLFEWMSILGEEVGELCGAVNETCFLNKRHPERGGMDNVYKEATQVAAVAIALMEAIDSGFCPNCGADMKTNEGGEKPGV